MAETLLAWFSRYLDDPKRLARRLNGQPVLVYEPADEPGAADSQDEDSYQYRTQSGAEVTSIGGGDPIAVVVEKTKDNAFQRRVTIGRTANNDIVLDDASVSRFHAWLQQEGDGGPWQVVDAGSMNGCTLADKRLPAKTPVRIEDGQSLKVGSVRLTFRTADSFVRYLKARASE